MAGQTSTFDSVRYAGYAIGIFKWGMGVKNFFQARADRAEQKADKEEAALTSKFQGALTKEYLSQNPTQVNSLSGGISTAIAEEAKHMAKNNGQQSRISEVLGLKK